MNNGLFTRRFTLAVLVLSFLFLVPATTALADLPFLKKKPQANAAKQPKKQQALQSPFRNSPWGDFAHQGQQDDPGQGYPHYDYRSRRYGHWYQPKQFGLTKIERCAPQLFRPRGYGNLFNRPSNCYRMDYNSYVLKDYRTDYGPSYYHNLPDPRCHKTNKGHCDDR